MKIYIAAPLFSEAERQWNMQFRDLLKSWGFDVYLPQADGGVATELIKKGGAVAEVRKKVFTGDSEAVKACDTLVAVLDGRVPDEGMLVELGMAFALGKRCIGYQTDTRRFDRHGNNLMIEGCLSGIAETKDTLRALLNDQ